MQYQIDDLDPEALLSDLREAEARASMYQSRAAEACRLAFDLTHAAKRAYLLLARESVSDNSYALHSAAEDLREALWAAGEKVGMVMCGETFKRRVFVDQLDSRIEDRAEEAREIQAVRDEMSGEAA